MTDEKIKEELKPCPICGHKGVLIRGMQASSVYCSHEPCATCGPRRSSDEEAIEAWNERAAERLAKIEVLEELRDKSEYKMNPEMYRFFTKKIDELKAGQDAQN